jgi:hypothetical protein
MSAQFQDPKEYYRGNAVGWGGIQQNLDVKRSFSDSVLVDAVLSSDNSDRSSELFMLKGPAGNGKTVALKRIAWEAATTYDQLVLYANNAASISLNPLAEIFQLTGKRIILCVDHIALFRAEVLSLLKESRARGIPLTVIGTERDNEWNIYCEGLESFVRQEFPVRYLNEREIEGLIQLLERHNALGILRDQGPKARIDAFVNNAGRQLLVALHEITLGMPFEEIVLDEYNRIEPPLARHIYLSICALHQFGAPVRAGIVSRIADIPFSQFKAEFLAPLQNVVHVMEDRHSRDMFYTSRHRHVAEMVFRKSLPREEDKFDLLASLVSTLNIDYSSDRETFSRLDLPLKISSR